MFEGSKLWPNWTGAVRSIKPETKGELKTSAPGKALATLAAQRTRMDNSYEPSGTVEGMVQVASETPVSV